MSAKSKAQARWARAGCPDSSISEEKCSHFVPHGKGSMSRLPERIRTGIIAHAKRAKARKK